MPTESRLIEIVGVAGTGKSTLAHALVERFAECRVAEVLRTRRPAHWPYVAHGLPRLMPLLAQTAGPRPKLSWDELKYLILVSEWSRYLRARPQHRAGITFLDQGPLFGLARLLWGGKPATGSAPFEGWMSRMVELWSSELDLVVWLDAPDEVVLERIERRSQRHDAKGRSSGEALELIHSHRRAYARVRELIDRAAALRVLDLDTSATTPAGLTEELGRFLDEMQWLTDRRTVLNVR